MHHTGIKTAKKIRKAAIERGFQLHHTGIKTRFFTAQTNTILLFQLHHTGIKTFPLLTCSRCGCPFQLHHTGIKTCLADSGKGIDQNFNCTIQELKREGAVIVWHTREVFQLHHTGIKTVFDEFQKLRSIDISIAPYRN